MSDVWDYTGLRNPGTGFGWTVEEARNDMGSPSYAGFFVPNDGREPQMWKPAAPWPELVRWRDQLHVQMAMGVGVLELRNVR